MGAARGSPQPYIENDSFAGFEVAGSLYALFAQRAADAKLVRGNSTVPYLRVRDIDLEFKRVAALAQRMLDRHVVHEGPIRLFRFEDPDGNVIELFSLATPPAG